jgi:hypothetical protein
MKRKNSAKSNFNYYIDSAQNKEVNSNSIESDDSIETEVDFPIKKQNSFLNPNDDIGTLKKGVVLDNQTYEYEVSDNDSSNFTILEAGDEPREIGE